MSEKSEDSYKDIDEINLKQNKHESDSELNANLSEKSDDLSSRNKNLKNLKRSGEQILNEPKLLKKLKHEEEKDKEISQDEEPKNDDIEEVNENEEIDDPHKEQLDLDIDEKINDNPLPKSKGKERMRKTHELSSDVVESEVDKIIQLMEESYEEDIQNIKIRQPALSKLKNLSTIEKTLKHNSIQEKFLDQNGLAYFEKWLSPSVDGNSVCALLKKKILENLKSFDINYDQLSNSTIGKIVMSIHRNQNETKDIIKLSKELIDKWTRVLMDNEVDYKRLSEANELENVERLKQRQQYKNKKSKETEVDIITNTKLNNKNVIQPKKNNIEFLVSPKCETITKKKGKEVSDGTKEIYKLMQNLRRNKDN